MNGLALCGNRGWGFAVRKPPGLVLRAEQPTAFVEENLPSAEEEEDIPKEEKPLLSALFISRETAFALLKTRDLSLEERCSLLLAFGAELQEALEEGNSSGILLPFGVLCPGGSLPPARIAEDTGCWERSFSKGNNAKASFIFRGVGTNGSQLAASPSFPPGNPSEILFRKRYGISSGCGTH